MLVDYSDSGSNDEAEKHQPAKKRKVESTDKARPPPPPPPPSSFHALYATNVRSATADDPSLHGGRNRQVPHVEGNWPTHVYLEWLPSQDSLTQLQRLITHIEHSKGKASIRSFLRSDLDVQLPLHISLSAPLTVTTDQKDVFQAALVTALRDSGARRFTVVPSGVEWVANLERSRYFLVIKLRKPINDDLNKLLLACNACAASWSLDQLYTPSNSNGSGQTNPHPSMNVQDQSSAFHISIAWSLEAPGTDDQETIGSIGSNSLQNMAIQFSDVVKIKIGNMISDVPLPD